MRARIWLITATAVLLTGASAFGQSIVSARSGAIHHVEGRALIDGQVVETDFAEFPNLRSGSVLATELGRIEMLLTPGVIFRMGPESSVRMISNSLADTQLEFLDGTALIEVVELLDDNAVAVFHNGSAIQPLRAGLYRIDAAPNELRVYDGRALLTRGDNKLTVKKGRMVHLGDTLLASEKFDTKTGDELYRWASRRSSYLAMANVSSARSYDQMGMAFGSGFVWNPYFGIFTYVPRRGMHYSPFGWSFYSPYTVVQAYERPSQSSSNASGGSSSGAGASSGPVAGGGGGLAAGSAASSPSGRPSPPSSGDAPARPGPVRREQR